MRSLPRLGAGRPCPKTILGVVMEFASGSPPRGPCPDTCPAIRRTSCPCLATVRPGLSAVRDLMAPRASMAVMAQPAGRLTLQAAGGEVGVGGAADGMINDDELVIGHAQHAAHELGGGDETRRHDADGWDALA